MTNTSGTGRAPCAFFELDEQGAAALARLTDRYADDLTAIQQREAVRATAVVHAVVHHQARRLLPDFRLIRVTDESAEELEDRAEDVADALSLLQTAREDLDSLEAALLLAARHPGARTGGKPLLTFRQIAAAIGAESEQAAQGRYRRKVGNPSSTESGNDGTP
jgi:predicted ArsR family transcriptional regulator